MKTSWLKFRLAAGLIPGERDEARPGKRPRLLSVLLLTMICALSVQGADPYAEALDRHVADLESGLKQQVRERAQGAHAAESSPANEISYLWVVVVVAVVTLVAQFGVRTLNRRFVEPASAKNEDPMQTILLEEGSIQAFFEELRAGPTALVSQGAAKNKGADGNPKEPGAPTAGPDPVSVFLSWAPAEAVKLQALFTQANRAEGTEARQKALLELSERLRSLCYGCRAPELRPIWQLAFALEGLTKQLAGQPSEVTASVVQTVAGGVDLLHTLCVEGLTAQLAAQAPARFLVVDDDAVSRFAVSASLKRAFDAPDLAPDPENGLALAAKQLYDIIFLDVEMPGMNGFELCKHIRETTQNQKTPVVFVTRHSDFESRAKAALSGGQHLLGKPFLALEITVKALTLVLRSRQPSPETKQKPRNQRQRGNRKNEVGAGARLVLNKRD